MSTSAAHTVRVDAPLRIDPFGGVTDIPEVAAIVGTDVVNIAVHVYADPNHEHRLTPSVFLAPSADNRRSLVYNGQPLVEEETFLLRLVADACAEYGWDGGLVATFCSGLRPNTGLGASAQLCLSVFAGVQALMTGGAVDVPSAAWAAHEFETVRSGIVGGTQDYISAAFGGVSRIREALDDQLASNLNGFDLDSELRSELAERLLIAVLNVPRSASNQLIEKLVARLATSQGQVREHLQEIVAANARMHGLLASADIEPNEALFAKLTATMNDTWAHHQALHPLIGVGLEKVGAIAQNFGAGAHGLGAGVNSLVLLVEPGLREVLRKAVNEVDGVVTYFAVPSNDGLQVHK